MFTEEEILKSFETHNSDEDNSILLNGQSAYAIAITYNNLPIFA